MLTGRAVVRDTLCVSGETAGSVGVRFCDRLLRLCEAVALSATCPVFSFTDVLLVMGPVIFGFGRSTLGRDFAASRMVSGRSSGFGLVSDSSQVTNAGDRSGR